MSPPGNSFSKVCANVFILYASSAPLVKFWYLNVGNVSFLGSMFLADSTMSSTILSASNLLIGFLFLAAYLINILATWFLSAAVGVNLLNKPASLFWNNS